MSLPFSFIDYRVKHM